VSNTTKKGRAVCLTFFGLGGTLGGTLPTKMDVGSQNGLFSPKTIRPYPTDNRMNSTTNTMENLTNTMENLTTAMETLTTITAPKIKKSKKFNPEKCKKLVFTFTNIVHTVNVMTYEDFKEGRGSGETEDEYRQVWVEMCRQSAAGCYDEEEEEENDDCDYDTASMVEQAIADAEREIAKKQ